MIEPLKPLIVQEDFTILIVGEQQGSEQAAQQLGAFADLIKRPGSVHTYKVTPLSVWNAAAAGISGEQILETLRLYSRYELPLEVCSGIATWSERYGKLRFERVHDRIRLVADCAATLKQLTEIHAIQESLSRSEQGAWWVRPSHRGLLKQELMRCGYPVLDLAGYHSGEQLPVSLRRSKVSGEAFQLRDYQLRAVDRFYREGSVHGGSGVLVLPCGAGKTIIGIAALARLNCAALILTSNVTSVKQWKRELLQRTTLTEEEIGEYAGSSRQVRPVTIATYQIMTHRSSKQDEFVHMGLFHERDWGLIIYDEVHLLPAPVFRMTAEIQATRRLGLTATLVREDGREEDVFSLIGPKRYDLPWKSLEASGWIAAVNCCEVRVPMPRSYADSYYQAQPRAKQRMASENPLKLQVVEAIMARHPLCQTIIIGQYLSQLQLLAERLGLPLLTGSTAHEQRERLFQAFRNGEQRTLIVSKIANFAVDLPDAVLAIQVSGSFGSRQEEAQRIGRILRPKQDGNQAWFYSLVSNETKEAEFALKRQLFMIEQGYRYEVIEWTADSEPQNWSVAAK